MRFGLLLLLAGCRGLLGFDEPEVRLFVGFVESSTTASEAMPARIAVGLSAPASEPVTVDVALAGTAIVERDFVVASELAFEPGEVTRFLEIEILDDGVAEAVELIELTIVAAAGAELAQPLHAVEIAEQVPVIELATPTAMLNEGDAGDRMVPVDATLSEPSEREVTVSYLVSGNADAVDVAIPAPPLVFPIGSTTQRIVLVVHGDIDSEPNDTAILTLEPASAMNGVVGGADTFALVITNDDGD